MTRVNWLGRSPSAMELAPGSPSPPPPSGQVGARGGALAVGPQQRALWRGLVAVPAAVGLDGRADHLVELLQWGAQVAPLQHILAGAVVMEQRERERGEGEGEGERVGWLGQYKTETSRKVCFPQYAFLSWSLIFFSFFLSGLF